MQVDHVAGNLAVPNPSENSHLFPIGQPVQTVGQGDCLQQGGLALHRVDARILDPALQGDLLALVFLDKYGHAGILQVGLGQSLLDQRFRLVHGQSTQLLLSQQGQGGIAFRIHPGDMVEFFRLEHLYLDQVLGTDAILVAVLVGAGCRVFIRLHHQLFQPFLPVYRFRNGRIAI